MALVGITEAARLAGVSEKTIRRKIESGIMSAQVSGHAGHQKKTIDTSELVRVFGGLPGQAPNIVQAKSLDMPVKSSEMSKPDGHVLAQVIETQKVLISVLQHQLDARTQEAGELRAQVKGLLEWRRPDPAQAPAPEPSVSPVPGPPSQMPTLPPPIFPRRYIAAGVVAAAAIAAVAWSWGAGYRLWFLI